MKRDTAEAEKAEESPSRPAAETHDWVPVCLVHEAVPTQRTLRP